VGWTLITDEPFNTLVENGWNYVGALPYVSLLTTDSSAPLSPPNVLQFFYPIGFGKAGTPSDGTAPGTEYHTFSAVPALYFGYWWKPSNPWQGHVSGVNKITFVRPADGSNYVLKMLGQSAPYHTQVTIEPASGGSTINYNENQDTTAVTLGRWHQMELYLNYTGGILNWWMDGKLKGSYAGIPFPGAGFTEISFSPTWGGTADPTGKIENNYYWIDHAHVSHP
jgi:hypothetical protein